ncbi:hypothetical protein ABIC74_005352 [Mucilaginibacter rubeus]|nr:hypothetical protein SAMN03159284_05328 [Mucilaginibacter sp. NFR10]
MGKLLKITPFNFLQLITRVIFNPEAELVITEVSIIMRFFTRLLCG